MMSRKTIMILGVFLFLTSGAVFAFTFPPRISWIPDELKPASLAPGVSARYALTLKHTGFLSIHATNQLNIVAQGDIVPFITLTQPLFASVFKKGNEVTIVVTVSVPSSTPFSVKTGELVLTRILPNGKVKEVWRAEELPVELTFSSFHLPPAPNKEEDEATIQGVDADTNGVPDRVDRWIGFQAPESEKKRAAMTLSAKAQQDFFTDYLTHLGEDQNAENVRMRVLGVNAIRERTSNCLQYVFGAQEGVVVAEAAWNAYRKNGRELQALFMDTPERIRAFWESERPLVATGGRDIQHDQYRQECLDLGFNPDMLPN